MKPFRFQKFTIQQLKKVFRVGTDGVLLGALSSVENSSKILEVGTGAGLVSLMLAQRNPFANILALEIDKIAANLASENFTNSIFSDKLKVLHQDFKNFQTDEKFDLIISNPPYFEENSSEKDVLARQKVELSFENLISKSAELLSSKGVFSVIIPSESTEDFCKISQKFNLKLIRKINIYGIKDGILKRNIVEFSHSPKNLVEEDFVIEKSPRNYSDQYLELTKEFHLFDKN